MEQHPVPQNISSYQFHLVGDMTLKQFLELAGGVVGGVIIYALQVPGFIKLPFIILSVAFGGALAFVPLQERPLEKWIASFFRSVYSPTLFNWEKKENVKYFQDETAPQTQSVVSSSFKIPFLSKLEEGESSYLTKLANIFNPTASSTATPTNPVTSVTTQPGPVLAPNIQNTQITSGQTNFFSSSPIEAPKPGIVTMNSTPNSTPISGPAPMAPVAGARDIKIPQAGFVSMQQPIRPHVVIEETPREKEEPAVPSFVGKGVVGQETKSGVTAEFSIDAAPPNLPTITNTISGQVMGSDKKIIEGAILEIRDEKGVALRALKTNNAGHFLIVTPLSNGKYKIVTEREGFEFPVTEFEATGGIIQPIAIKAK